MTLAKELSQPELIHEVFRKLFNNSSDPIFIADPDLKMEIVNRSFLELFHFKEDEVKGLGLRSLFKKEKRFQELLDELQGSEKLKEVDVDLIDFHHETIHALLSLIPIYNDADGLIGFQGIIHDITARVDAQQRLGRAQKVALTGRMARTIAHEIRNPLTNISLALANLQTGERTEEENFLLELIANNADRINDLLTELLDSARPAELVLDEVVVQDLISEALDLAIDRMKLQAIELEIELPQDEIRVEADLNKVKLALNNIIINAIEAMPDGGKVRIVTKQTNQRTIISIEDSGTGIPPEELNNLFDPFFTKKSNGTGLGLTTVQNIIERHGWNVEVESEVGNGTCFHISIDR